MSERMLDIIARAKELGLIRERGPALTFPPWNYRQLTEMRLLKFGIVYGADERWATEYVLWLKRHPKFSCCYCRRRVAFVSRRADHFIPLARGGRHIVENLVPSCRSCNGRKAAATHWVRPKVAKALRPDKWMAAIGVLEIDWD